MSIVLHFFFYIYLSKQEKTVISLRAQFSTYIHIYEQEKQSSHLEAESRLISRRKQVTDYFHG